MTTYQPELPCLRPYAVHTCNIVAPPILPDEPLQARADARRKRQELRRRLQNRQNGTKEAVCHA